VFQVEPLRPAHLDLIPELEDAEYKLGAGRGVMVRQADRPLIATGIVPLHARRGLGWTWSAEPCPPRAWLWLLVPAIAVIERAHAEGFRRLEIYVDANHGAGLRWARRLGFQVAALLEQFTEDGRTVFMLERVR